MRTLQGLLLCAQMMNLCSVLTTVLSCLVCISGNPVRMNVDIPKIAYSKKDVSDTQMYHFDKIYVTSLIGLFVYSHLLVSFAACVHSLNTNQQHQLDLK